MAEMPSRRELQLLGVRSTFLLPFLRMWRMGLHSTDLLPRQCRHPRRPVAPTSSRRVGKVRVQVRLALREARSLLHLICYEGIEGLTTTPELEVQSPMPVRTEVLPCRREASDFLDVPSLLRCLEHYIVESSINYLISVFVGNH